MPSFIFLFLFPFSLSILTSLLRNLCNGALGCVSKFVNFSTQLLFAILFYGSQNSSLLLSLWINIFCISFDCLYFGKVEHNPLSRIAAEQIISIYIYYKFTQIFSSLNYI